MKLYDYFKENKDRNFIFIKPNAGNWGDNIIRMGAKKMADKLKISYDEYDSIDGKAAIITKTRDKNDILYVHGCGGIGSIYDFPAGYVLRLRKYNPDNEIVWGPTTAMLHGEYLKENLLRDDKFTFFAREERTYNLLKRIIPNLKLELDECPSLYLTEDDFKQEVTDYPNANYLLLRDDKYEKIPEPFSYDKRKQFNLVYDPVKANTFDEWVAYHKEPDAITTNRTHSAILGAILGKKVRLFRNNYHKNESIWEYSLKKRGVEWLNI